MSSAFYAEMNDVDFSEANLSNIDLSYANICGTEFEDANLQNANLAFSQVLDSGFNRATLTGACIEAWQDSSTTDLVNVKCDYIYRKWNPKTDQFESRLPTDSSIFKPGEFTKRYQLHASATKTIDLTFTDGIDWQAFFQSLQGVREQYPESEVGLQAIEKKGTTFVIRVETTHDAPQAAIESTSKELYEAQLQLREAQGEIKVLREMNQVLERLAGTPMTKNEIHIQNAGNVANEVHGSQKAIQHNYASEFRPTPAESAKAIQDLLIQLQQSNPTDIQSVIEQRVKRDSTLRQRIKNALKEGGLETMKVIFPLTGIAIETVRGWVEVEGD